MSKLAAAGLMLIVGLAIGLWLGFNPTAHKETERTWNQARTSIVGLESQAGVKTPKARTTITTSKPAPDVKPIATDAWKQITTAFNTLLASVERLWTNISARISTTR